MLENEIPIRSNNWIPLENLKKEGLEVNFNSLLHTAPNRKCYKNFSEHISMEAVASHSMGISTAMPI